MVDALQADVAIIIPTYNSERTIERAVRSALEQTASVEVIIVDNCSSDATMDIVLRLALEDHRMKVIRLQVNGGPARARNVAMKATSAPWICPLDGDDFMAASRVSDLLAITGSGDWDFVADDIFKVDDGALDVSKHRLWSEYDFGRRKITLSYFVRGNISARRGCRRELGFVKPLMRRDFLVAHKLSYDEDMWLGEDYALYARALALGARFCLVDPCGYYAVERPDSLTGKHDAGARGAIVAFDRRLLRMPGLDPEARKAITAHMLESYCEWALRCLIDAVKARDAAKAVGCFNAPPRVAVSLAGRLSWQALVRSGRFLGISETK